MKKKVEIVVYSILITTFLTGCWTRRELKDMSFIFARGFDINDEGEYISSAQAVDTGKGTEKGGNRALSYYVIESEGRSAFATSRNGARESGRRVYTGHTSAHIIGKKVAENGVLELVDHWYRDIDAVPTSNIFISKGLASEIVRMEHPAEDIPGMAIEQLIKVSYATSKVATIQMYQLMNKLTSKTSGAYATGIEIVTHKDGSRAIRLSETAILKKDKLIGWFDDYESRGLLWIIDEVKTGDIEVQSPTAKGGEQDIIALKILKQRMGKVEPKIEDGKLSVTVKVKADCMVANVTDTKINLDKVSTIKELEKRAETQIRGDIQRSLDKGVKEYNVDVFGFDNAFHRNYPKQWKELEEKWDEELKKIQVKQEVEVKIRRIGLMTSYGEEEE